MKRLIFESWLLLFYFDCVMRFRDFKRLVNVVRNKEIRSLATMNRTSEELCHAVDVACVFYFKPVLCLQRSAAAAILLRRYGWKAQMVLAVQILPFSSHAWVEIEGCVVNDKSYMPEIFQVLERC
jgi:hypothetical protein